MILARNSITLHHLRDITTVVWYYRLQASTASPPAKPTTETPSGWSTTEPSYTEGSTNSLYVVQKTTFSDGTFEYSDVSLSTSYEAAKAAYNKSVQAQTTANAAQESIDNLEIGGRNLFGLGSDCSATLDGMKNIGFELVTEDGFQCAHATGALTTTRYLQSKIPYTAKPLEKVVFSADVKIKDIALGTTNPMCEFYFSGQTINGSWKGTKSAQTYIDGQLVGVGNKKFNTFLPNNEWHHVTVKVEYTDAEFTVLMNPSIYFRDATGEIWIKNIKFERGNQETDWSPAPEDGKPLIATKKYTDIIGTANDTANATFYFAKIHPTNYTVQWNVSLRFRVVAPEAYAQDVTISLGGYGSSFSSYNAYTVRTGSIGMYYVSLYRATSTGISTNHKGHALGFSLKNATQPTNTSYKRTIIVDVIETENCTVEMLDTAVKYASIDGTGSTNYSGTAPTEMSVATAGQNATNNTNTSRTQFASAVKAGAFGCKRYTLLMKDTDDTWVSFVNQSNNTGTSKTVSAGGHMLGKLIYLDAGSDYASGSNTGAVFDAREFDFRYSSNCGSTLVAHRPVYLVGTIHSDGLFYFDADTSKWYTQEVPTTEDGRTYIYVGMAYSTSSVWLSTENDAYQYYAGKFRTLREIEEMEAAKTATNYLAMDNTGIMVADMSGGTQYTPSTVPSGVKNAFIDNDSFNVRDGQDVLASFGETSHIGKLGEAHLEQTATGVDVVDSNGTNKVRFGAQSEVTVWEEESHMVAGYISDGGTIVNASTEFSLPAELAASQNMTLTIGSSSYTIPTGQTYSYTGSNYSIAYDGSRSVVVTNLSSSTITAVLRYPATQPTDYGITAVTPANTRIKTRVYANDTLLAEGGVYANGAGNFGLYDAKHGKWLISSDSSGNVTIPSLVPKLLYASKVGAPSSQNVWNYMNIQLKQWAVIAIRAVVQNCMQYLIFFTGAPGNQYISDRPADVYIRGGFKVDWDAGRIYVRWVNGNSTTYQNVYFDRVYGLIRK